jgi:hypothetical protein
VRRRPTAFLLLTTKHYKRKRKRNKMNQLNIEKGLID